MDVWVQWSETSEKASGNTEQMYRGKWASFQHDREQGVTWGTVLHIARENGYKPRRNRKPVRLHKKTDFQCVLEPLLKSRELLKKMFESGKRFLGLRADTVVGKTEQAKEYYLKGYGGFFSTPTTTLAKEVSQRFDDAEINVFRWRGIASEPDGKFPHEKPCEFADEYTALLEKGRNPYKLKCENCQYRNVCDVDGYRSQEEEAKQAEVVVSPHKDLLMNPTFRSTAKRILPDNDDDLITVDEFDIIESFNRVELAQARLEYLRDTWHDHSLGEFAKRVLDACVVQNASYTGISHIVATLSTDEREEIITALGQLRIGDEIMDVDEAEDYESRTGQLAGLDNIKQLPLIERDADWNLVTKLELFFDVYHHAETAPMAWDDSTLTFFLPPLPTYTNARVMLMSATLKEAFFRQVFRGRQEKRGDVEFVDLENTEWHPDVRVFQLRTNRNPRRTLLQGEQDDNGRWKYTHELTATGQKYLDRITASIENADKQCGFIGHKAVVDNYTEGMDAATGHFGGLVGLNQHFSRDDDDGIILHILGTPNIGETAVQLSAKLLFGMTDAPLYFSRNEDGTYTDTNVQAVADAIIQAELTQAVGRAGLAKNPSTVVIWTSYELPSITHREQTILFDENDWEQAEGNLDALAEVVAERQEADKALAEAIEKGDTKTVADMMGVSERHARRITEEPRQKNDDQKKAEQEAKVIELHKRGLSQRAIKDEVGISLGSVNTIVKAFKNGHRHGTINHEDVRKRTLSQTPVTIEEKTTPPEKPVNINHKENTMSHGTLNANDPYNLLTHPPEDLTNEIIRINDIANDEQHPECQKARNAMSKLGSLMHKRFGHGWDTPYYDTMVAPGVVFSGGMSDEYQDYLEYKRRQAQ